MLQYQKMQTKDFGQLGLQDTMFLEMVHTVDITARLKTSADGTIINKSGPLILKMIVLLELILDVNPQIILIDMVVMTPVSLPLVRDLVHPFLEARVMADPRRTEIEEAL